MIRILFITAIFAFGISQTNAQSRKEAKKNKIKTTVVTKTENNKTIFESKSTFDKNGNETERVRVRGQAGKSRSAGPT